MAQDVTGITVEIRGDKAAADARRLDASLDRLGRTGTKTESSFERLERKSIGVGRGFDALRRRSFGLQSAFRGLSGVATGLGVVLTFRELTSTITLFEKLEGSLITATGSAFEASRAFDELEQFAANTPTSLDQVVGAFIKLKNFGLDPSEEALRSYGNTASALGKDLNQMIEAVADATNFEMERLREFGIVARQQGEEVAFTFQGVTTVVGRNAAEIEGYLRKIGDVNFAGAMEDQMNRLPGLFSNLGDSVARLFREIGEAGATDILAAGLRQAINVVNSLADNVDVAFIKIQANFELFQRSVNNILAEFGTSIEDIGPKVETLSTKFLEFGSDVIDVLTNLPAYVEGFVKVAKADFNILKAEIIGGFLKIEQGARLAWENISFAASSAWEKIKSSFFDALSEMGDKLATFSELAIQALPVLPGFNLALGPAVSMAAEALRGLGDSSDTAQSKLSQLEVQHNKNVSAIQGHIDAINEVKEETINAAQAEIAAAREGLQASLNARDKRIDSLMREKENMELLDDRAAAILNTLEKNTKATGESASVTENFADSIQSLHEQLDPVVRAEREFQENTALLNRALKEGQIDLAEYNKLMGLTLEAYNNIAGKGEKVAKEIDKASSSSKNLFNEADQAAKRLQGVFESTAIDLQRQVALYGQVGNAAELRYELEHGALRALSADRKDYLLSLARELDTMDANIGKFEQMQDIREQGLRIFREGLPEAEQRQIREAELTFLFDKGAFGEGQTAVDTLNRALDNLRDKGHGASDAARDLGLTFASAFEEAILQAQSLGDILQGLAQDILRMTTRMLITQPLATGLTHLFGGIGIGAATAHAGGVIGADALPSRFVHPAVFDTAPRFHVGGLSSNEVPAILQRGEGVFTPQQMAALSPASTPVQVQVIDQRTNAPPVEVQQSQGPNGAKQIRLLVRDEMKSALGSGIMDRDMAVNYGLRRPGARR